MVLSDTGGCCGEIFYQEIQRKDISHADDSMRVEHIWNMDGVKMRSLEHRNVIAAVSACFRLEKPNLRMGKRPHVEYSILKSGDLHMHSFCVSDNSEGDIVRKTVR